MKVKLFLGDGFLFLRGAPKRRRGGLVKRVFSVQWGDRAAKSERREVEEARREDLRGLAAGGELGIIVSEVRNQGVDHEAVLEVVPPLVQLESAPLLLLRCSPHRRYAMVLGRRRILAGF